ncbi:hypothetical protein [Planctomicrobium sp. SH664]|uniref:hypothetical protein n=1 Tax=Planctomicrobium sp. SH664 TaxID=3448125 RepID=UPI003F5B0D2B
MSQSSAKEAPCPDCGEMVRVNSLRCWNCGAFMNRELEQRYLAMQANPAPTIFSELPADEAHALDDVNSGEDDDFELSLPVAKAAPKSVAVKPAEEPETFAIAQDPEEPAASESAAQPAAKPATAEASRSAPGEPDVAHSVATGGDALLDIAIQEERDQKKRGKLRRPAGGMRTATGGLIIYCPYGCKVEVKDQHRGMTGKCPRCGAPFIVPIDPPQYKKQEETAPTPEQAAAAAAAPGAIQIWIPDLHLHIVNPANLKLKPDSLLKDFTEVDVGFSKEKLFVGALAKKAAGLFAKGPKKDEVRAALLAYAQELKPLADAPVDQKYLYSNDQVGQIKVVQPAASRANSLFHGVLVFGEGRIAIQLPESDQVKDLAYLSMGLTQFWSFAKALENIYGVSGLGADCGIPMEARYSLYKCHYLDVPIKALEDVEYYKADPSAQLEVAGYRCGSCKLAVSETGRKKENLGGKSPKGIAKAKCPKCSSKMGEHLLYSLKSDIAQPSMNE